MSSTIQSELTNLLKLGMAYLMKSRKRKRNKRPRDRLKYFIIDTQQLPNIVLSKSYNATTFRAIYINFIPDWQGDEGQTNVF